MRRQKDGNLKLHLQLVAPSTEGLCGASAKSWRFHGAEVQQWQCVVAQAGYPPGIFRGIPSLGSSDGCGRSCLPSKILVALSSCSKTSLEPGGGVIGAIPDAGIPAPPASWTQPWRGLRTSCLPKPPTLVHSRASSWEQPALGSAHLGNPWECSSWHPNL